ncbi:MAG TPA: cell division protein, partial [Halieaceae bacterium]|nr:cell division protein [Halieaceae bacterium]
GAWFVNFGSYVQRAIAERWAQRLERDGGNAVAGRVVIQPATVSGQDLFRVRVTGLESQQQARGIAATLEARYGLARLWVGRSERG